MRVGSPIEAVTEAIVQARKRGYATEHCDIELWQQKWPSMGCGHKVVDGRANAISDVVVVTAPDRGRALVFSGKRLMYEVDPKQEWFGVAMTARRMPSVAELEHYSGAQTG